MLRGLRVELTAENASRAGFVCDESLIVKEVTETGVASAEGIKVGMKLIGFGQFVTVFGKSF